VTHLEALTAWALAAPKRSFEIRFQGSNYIGRAEVRVETLDNNKRYFAVIAVDDPNDARVDLCLKDAVRRVLKASEVDK
jgi:hypothetical protein